MNDYVILTDSASDLPSKIANDLDIKVLPMKYIMENEFYTEGNLSPEKFHSLLKSKASISTTQINVEEFSEYFSSYLEEGKDIIYVGFSLSLSGMYNSALRAGEKLREKYPNRRIMVLDSVCASVGQGLLTYYLALKKKTDNFNINDAENWVNKNKLRFCHWFTVDDLYYLKRGGRISSATAVIGSILNIKPLLSMSDEGKLCVIEKIRGRKKTLDTMVYKIKNNLDPENKLVFIGHVDCIDDAKYVSNKIGQEFCLETQIVNIGPIIGTHTGPGTIAIGFMGNSRK